MTLEFPPAPATVAVRKASLSRRSAKRAVDTISAVVIVDSDSYTKWGVAILASMPADWNKKILLVATPVAPSAAQLTAAVAGSGFVSADVSRVGVAEVIRRVRADKPDVVLVSMLGLPATVVLKELHELPDRPVLVTGLPGISIPATELAILRRVQADLFLVHSKREVRAFELLAAELGTDLRFALSRLPFVRTALTATETADTRVRADIVFAAQAIVPLDRTDRKRMLSILALLAETHPQYRVVIKLRATRGEQQTHDEDDSYEDLLDELENAPANLVVASGPMGRFLDDAAALVTISSTSAIEAIALGVPVIALDEFGVGPDLINDVFVDSGLLADAEALVAADFRTPAPHWLDDNYFHADADNTWLTALDELLRERSLGMLPDRAPLEPRRGGALRRAWERRKEFGGLDRSPSAIVALIVGVPARAVVRLVLFVRTPRAVRAANRILGG